MCIYFQLIFQFFAGDVNTVLHGADWNLEQFGDLGDRPAVQMVKGEQGALLE